MSVLVLLEMKMKPENVDDLTDFLKSELHATRGFDGCNGLTFHRNQDDPNTMIAVEDWDSRQQYEKYRSLAHRKGGLWEVDGMDAGGSQHPILRQRGRIAINLIADPVP